MPEPYFVTEVERQLAARRKKWQPLRILLLVIAVVIAYLALTALVMLTRHGTPRYESIVQHFKYGSIGSEQESGIPYRVWMALPNLFPEIFENRNDYTAFGFLYEKDARGRQRDLPIGVSRRTVNGVDLIWLNCAICHTGTYRQKAGDPPTIVPGMPSNNLHFESFVRFILTTATDERLAPETLMPAVEAVGPRFGTMERLAWKSVVLPRLREGLLLRFNQLSPLLKRQPDWGPGRVDTFNPYKVGPFKIPAASLTDAEVIGASDFPSIFEQGPREGMHLHWDGNNTSLAERNLSAALGAGVTPETVDHGAIDRVADWLLTLKPPPSPFSPDPSAVERGRAVYMTACSGCHGFKETSGYVFKGDAIGQVDPIDKIGTDRARLDSYTEEFRQRQFGELFAGTYYAFKNFRKTDGYANMPLDGLWLRGPYLHNGSVPTLRDLLNPPDQRPVAFLRNSDVVDGVNGGFVSPPCDPSQTQLTGFCYDTSQTGNHNSGHLYGTDLPAAQKGDLLAYLLTF
ncbi:cytochrome c [Labrys okinawensis]|uniref:c-type cytochrome n=1 Tax=Labrys okinawensis TaxID=346911 RepID=UPI0039BCA78B